MEHQRSVRESGWYAWADQGSGWPRTFRVPMPILGRAQTVPFPVRDRGLSSDEPQAWIGQGRELFADSAAAGHVASWDCMRYRKLRGHCASNDVTDAASFVA